MLESRKDITNIAKKKLPLKKKILKKEKKKASVIINGVGDVATVIVVGVIMACMVVGVTIFKIISIQEKKKNRKKKTNKSVARWCHRHSWCCHSIVRYYF